MLTGHSQTSSARPEVEPWGAKRTSLGLVDLEILASIVSENSSMAISSGLIQGEPLLALGTRILGGPALTVGDLVSLLA